MAEAKERYWSGCGLVRKANGRRDVIVAGGQMKFDSSYSSDVDIYSVDDDSWSEGRYEYNAQKKWRENEHQRI